MGSASRIEPVARPDGRVTLAHWSDRRGLKQLDPKRWGQNWNLLPREEQETIGDAPNRTYYGLHVGDGPFGYEREWGLGDHRYQASIPLSDLYDYEGDPDGLTAKARELAEAADDDPRSLYFEQAIKAAGYKGYWINSKSLGLVAAVYEKLPVSYLGKEDAADFFAQSAHIQYDPGLGFRSALFDAVTGPKAPAKASPEQWLATLQNTPGVKKEELEWLGLEDWLNGLKGQSVTREDVQTFIANNGVRLQEVELNGEIPEERLQAETDRLERQAIENYDYEPTYFVDEDTEERYNAETGDYEEVPVWRVNGSSESWDTEAEAQEVADEYNSDAEREWLDNQDFRGQAERHLADEYEPRWADYTLEGGQNYRELLITFPNGENKPGRPKFDGSHWGNIPDIMAHARLMDRHDMDGKKVLFVEEIQSDWHQQGRDHGYSDGVVATPEELEASRAHWEQAKQAFTDAQAKLVEFSRGLAQRADLPIIADLHKQIRETRERYAAMSETDRAVAANRGQGPDNWVSGIAKAIIALTEDRGLPQHQIDNAAVTLANFFGQMYDEERHNEANWEPITHEYQRVAKEADELVKARNLARLREEEAVNAHTLVERKGRGGIPDAPYKDSWPRLVMRRLISYAVEHGYERVALTRGDLIGPIVGADDKTNWFYGRNLINITNDLLKKAGQKLHTDRVVLSRHGHSPSGMEDARFLLAHHTDLANEVKALTERMVDLAEQAGLVRPAEGESLDQVIDDTYKWTRLRADAIMAADPTATANPERDGKPLMQDPFAADWKDELQGVPLGTMHLHPELVKLQAVMFAHDELVRKRRELSSATNTIESYVPEVPFFEVTPELKAMVEQGQPLFQADGAKPAPRGTFNPQTSMITLLKGADLSTFLHETGHFYLESLAHLAAMENAPADIKVDWDLAASFVGFKGMAPEAWLSTPVEARREGHERWARGFERYLMEGKAPSLQLQPAFQRFKAWLVNVYEKLANLNVSLTPEVRGVFDRMLATEADIRSAEQARKMVPLFETKPPTMTEAEWHAYQRLGQQATADAEDQLQSRSIRDMQWLSNAKDRLIRKLQGQANEARKAVRAEVTAEVMRQPVYAAREFLKRGTLPEGLAWEGSTKLDLGKLRELYGEAPTALEEVTGQKKMAVDYRKLGYGKYGMLAEEGADPATVAELFGFSSADELVKALLAAPDPREQIQGLTDQRMLQEHGDLTDPQAIQAAADKAIHNDARLRFVATEANALAKAVGKRKILAEAARNYAAQLIGNTKVRDLRPARYSAAETRAAADAAKLAAKGSLEEAAMAKRNQLINGYAAKATLDAQAEVEKALRLFARLQGEGARKNIDPDYRDQIDALLERFDLRKGQSLKAIDKRKSLLDWIEQQRAKGFEPIVASDPALLNEANRRSYKDMTVDELRGLVEAVQNILHLGRLKNRLLVAAKQRAFQAVRDEMVDTITSEAYQTFPDKLEHNQLADGLKAGIFSFLAIHRKLASIMREMGGFKDRTILWDAITRPMNERYDWEAGRREQATKALHALYTPLVKEGKLKQKLFIPEIGTSLSLEGRIAVALNWGNDLNRARILDGDRWTAPQVEAILKTLSPEHLAFVNAMHEYLDSFWPEIAAKERRVTGVEPERVDPTPYQLEAADGSIVDMRGGYYPIKYDTERSSRSEAHEKAEAIRATMQGLYTAATTRRGHTKARVEKVERPVRKDLMVPFQHVTQVLHDLAFHEYLIDANRLLGSREVEMAIRAHYGTETIRALQGTLQAIAEGDIPPQNGLERGINYLRSGTTIAGLGWNLMTSLLQPLGLTQSVVRVGPKWMARAIGRTMTDAVTLQNTGKWIAAKSDFMRLRQLTMMREINEVSNRVKATWKPNAWGTVEQTFFDMIGRLQLIADVPTWVGEYDKQIAKGEADEDAVKLADQAVRDSQGSGYLGDLAGVQRGNVWMKLWTTFYSFFNVAHNQLAESIAQTRKEGISRTPALAADFFLIAFLPTALQEIIKRAVKGDDWDGLVPDILKQELGFLMGMFLGLREMSTVIQSDGKQPASPGGLRILTDAGQLYGDLHKGFTEGTFPDRTRKDVVNTASILLHLPGAQINRTWDGMEALAEGRTRNPLVLAFGPPHQQK